MWVFMLTLMLFNYPQAIYVGPYETQEKCQAVQRDFTMIVPYGWSKTICFLKPGP